MTSFKRPRIVPLIAPLLLAACSTVNSNPCPPVRVYDDAFRKRAVAELSLLPVDSAIEQMLADYAVMRAQARACG
jgi:hypothetical protein